jgi:hypothetical protein
MAMCPGPEVTGQAGPFLGWLLRKCARARGPYSIYMTLAGVLAMALTLTLPWLARLRARAWWLVALAVMALPFALARQGGRAEAAG